MKYVFFGSPIFARLVLQELLQAGLSPLAVVCNPDRPAGRHQTLTPPEIKRWLEEYELGIKNYELSAGNRIEILQPEDPASLTSHLSHLEPDVFVVAAYGKILKSEVLNLPRLGTIGVHSSLLPKYRGTSPIQNAILAGDTETGATIYQMDDKMDHGPIFAQTRVSISPTDTHDSLYPRIWSGGGAELAKLLPKIAAGQAKSKPQDESLATYTKKLSGADGFVEPADLAAAEAGDAVKAALLDRKIRALNPEPGVWTWFSSQQQVASSQHEKKRMKLLTAKIVDGKLVLQKIQIEGERPRDLSS